MATVLNEKLLALLRRLADKYEAADFLNGDPSWFMHQVSGRENREVMGFLASVLSYGRRDLFFPKIQYMLDRSGGEPFRWVLEKAYERDIPDDDRCYYRLYSNRMMRRLLAATRELLAEYGSLGGFVKAKAPGRTTLEALTALSAHYLGHGIKGMVASPRTSVAKRPCMFMRWMVRPGSPVDLGLWSAFIDRGTLFIPMDTHVLQEARRLGLINSKSASWHTVEQLTDSLREAFPDDPVRGDFALFGVGVDNDNL